MPSDAAGEFLSSGEFARRAHLSPKALRIYGEIGLLQPVEVDPANGYRRYGVSQIRTARLIAMLRAVDMSLADIGSLLHDLERDANTATARLGDHLLALEAHHASRRSLVRHIHAILREEDRPMFTISIRHEPSRRLLSVQRRLRAPETDAFVREARELFATHPGGRDAPGPFSLIFHGVVDFESDGPLEASLACGDETEATALVGIRTEPAHDEAYTTVTKAQWDYPAILAAYDAVACSPEVAARPGSPLSCREVYLAEPEGVGPDDLLCDIAFPLGPAPTS